jgi:hypothetical protein
MTDQKISPHKVTKPIQLLAAWLVGLCLVNSAFLLAALNIGIPWLQGTLVVAAVLNVPLFISAIFLLQTKFRPEMQEDSFYAQYLDKKTNQVIAVTGADIAASRFKKLEEDISRLNDSLKTAFSPHMKIQESGITKARTKAYKVSINDYLPDYSAIRDELLKSKIPVHDIFGKVNKSKPPTKFIVSIGNAVAIEFITNLLKILRNYHIDGIKIFDSFNDPDPDPSDIYIGSYGYEDGYVEFNQNLFDLIEKPIEMVDLEHYCKLNEIKLEKT